MKTNQTCQLPNPTQGGRADEDTVSSFSRPKNPNFSQYVHGRAIRDRSVACKVDQEERFAERINIVDKIAGGMFNSLQVL